MNRKQRRSQKPSDSDPDVPLAHPPSNPNLPAKTLYEIAAERQAALRPDDPTGSSTPLTKENVVNVAIGPDGRIQTLDNTQLLGIADDATEPLADTVLLATSLSALHFTLEALTVHQYADELVWTTIFFHAVFLAFPVLALLVHTAHGHIVSVPIKLGQRGKKVMEVVRQAVFVGIANVTGCYLVYLTNDKGYMAVMKNAPSIGTVWVWAVIELGLAGALAGVAGPGLFAWYYGYGIF